MRNRGEWRATAEPAAIGQLRHALADFLAGQRIAADVVYNVALCTNEALTNAVLHAFRNRSQSGTVWVSAEVDDRGLIARVEDDGIGFAPRADSPGMGLGLPLIGGLSDSMSITTRAHGGTVIRMSFGPADVAGRTDGAKGGGQRR